MIDESMPLPDYGELRNKIDLVQRCYDDMLKRSKAAEQALSAERKRREEVERERDSYKRAKVENDERFMLERDGARTERDALRAKLAECEREREETEKERNEARAGVELLKRERESARTFAMGVHRALIASGYQPGRHPAEEKIDELAAERDSLRAKLAAAESALDRWQTGTQIEGDYMRANGDVVADVRAKLAAVEAERDEARAALEAVHSAEPGESALQFGARMQRERDEARAGVTASGRQLDSLRTQVSDLENKLVDRTATLTLERDDLRQSLALATAALELAEGREREVVERLKRCEAVVASARFIAGYMRANGDAKSDLTLPLRAHVREHCPRLFDLIERCEQVIDALDAAPAAAETEPASSPSQCSGTCDECGRQCRLSPGHKNFLHDCCRDETCHRPHASGPAPDPHAGCVAAALKVVAYAAVEASRESTGPAADGLLWLSKKLYERLEDPGQ